MYHRFAVYVTPPSHSPLATFGAQWLGWDNHAGCAVRQPDIDVLDVAAITGTPRKYGFHGTVKPPFSLAKGATVEALQQSLEDLCAQLAPIRLEGLELARLGRFLALVPRGPTGALGAVAARVVQELDTFRAPLTLAEMEKRKPDRLSVEQQENLVRWGYPHVMGQFRFHMTLTQRLGPSILSQAESELAERLNSIPLSPFVIGDLTLLSSDDRGYFKTLSRHSLSGR